MEKLLRKLTKDVYELTEQGRFNEALSDLENIAVECLDLAALIYGQNFSNPRTAFRLMKAALSINPRSHIVYTNLAHICNVNLMFKEAYDAIQKAIEYSSCPQADVIYNAGVIAGNLGLFDQAEAFYRASLQLHNDPKVRYNLASTLLTRQKYDEGWKYYESRFEAFAKTKTIRDRFSQPSWKGEKAKDKTLLLFSEQGVGDVLQFARYIPEVKKRVKKVVFEVQESCADLIQKSFKIDVIPRKDDGWPIHKEGDLVASICSLPGVFGVKGTKTPYIKANKKKQSKDFKIGICWAGNPDHPNDYARSCHLKNFLPLLEVPGTKFYSFQKGSMSRGWPLGRVNLGTIDGLPIEDAAAYCNNWTDTANTIADFDLIITVDTGFAHLAGAMGIPVWNIIGFIHDWRWLESPNEGSDWYPSMRLFRQKTFGDWNPVFQNIQQELVEALKIHARPL